MSKQYIVEKITDILAIPEDKFDDFLVDLRAYYQLGCSVPNLIDEISNTMGVKTQTIPQKMVWIDDGKHEARVTIKTMEGKNAPT